MAVLFVELDLERKKVLLSKKLNGNGGRNLKVEGELTDLEWLEQCLAFHGALVNSWRYSHHKPRGVPREDEVE